jgi:hypothetical protein
MTPCLLYFEDEVLTVNTGIVEAAAAEEAAVVPNAMEAAARRRIPITRMLIR